jgi:hypothetical protein
MKKKIFLIHAALIGFSGTLAQAGSFTEAQFTRIDNEVKVLKENVAPENATVGRQINAVTSVATGANSRAELKFPDQSLTRLGANSRFTLRGEGRMIDLNQGVIMLQVPKQMGGAKVRTAAVTAAVTGTTIMIEYQPDGYIKVIVIEGSLDLYPNNDPSKFRTVTAGQMIIMKPDTKFIPEPVDIDLKLLLKNSKLLSSDDPNQPNNKQVNNAINDQQGKIKDGDLVKTNLLIPGRGTVVTLTNDIRLNLFNNIGVKDNPNNGPKLPPGTNIVNSVNGKPLAPQVPIVQSTTVLNETSTIHTDPDITAWNSQTGSSLTSEGKFYYGAGTYTHGTDSGSIIVDDGPLPAFVFGTPNLLRGDTQLLIDKSAPWSVFSFEKLLINGTPTIDTGSVSIGEGYGPAYPYLILAAAGDIDLAAESPFGTAATVGAGPGSTGSTLDLSTNLDLYSLTLYSNAGNIHLKSGFTIHAGENSTVGTDNVGYPPVGYGGSEQDVNLIAAGLNSDITIEGAINLDGPSSLYLDAGRNAVITGESAIVVADAITIFADHDIFIGNGAAVTSRNGMNLTAGNDITITGEAEVAASSDSYRASFNVISQGGNITISDNSTVSAVDQLWIESLLKDVSVINSSLSASDIQVFAAQDVKLQGANLTAQSSVAPGSVPPTLGTNEISTLPKKGIKIEAERHINITDSSQLKVLLDGAPALLRVASNTGNVTISDSELSSSGDIEVESVQGNVTLKNLNVSSSDVFKARTQGPNGLLTIDGGTVNANSIIRLYGEGANGVLFKGTTTLNTSEVQIAGKIVEVQSGGNVNVTQGNAHVFSDDHRYNKPNYGNINSTNLSQYSFGDTRKPEFYSGGKVRVNPY